MFSKHVLAEGIRPSHAAVFLLVGVLLLSALRAGASNLIPRYQREKPAHSRLWSGLCHDLLVVKFVDDDEVRLRSGRLVSLAGANLQEVNSLLMEREEVKVARLFTRPESELQADRIRAQTLTGREMADLNNYYRIEIENSAAAFAEDLLDQLNALPIVEIAYAEPEYELATIRASAGTPSVLPPATGRDTPDFVPLQDYLDPAPLGVDAFDAWTYPGGRGESVKIIDIELGWNWDHEDLKLPFYQGGFPYEDDHGTAVVGEILGQHNGYGINGIASEVEIGGHSVLDAAPAEAIDIVAAALDPGDIFVIELHAPGPEAGGGQSGYIPIEWWQANFDAIWMATANGIICCAAAGNGEADLDNPIYEGLFDRNIRDSGAIIVGAAVGTTLEPEWFTNYGSRVDLHGWGSLVVTTGYGDLQGGSDQDLWYTAVFGGTSSATPIVVGAVACVQGVYKNLSGGVPLTAGTIAQVLKETGTPQSGFPHIGPRPNLAAAIPLVLSDLATVAGTVTESELRVPLEGVEVRLLETGARTYTTADGSYSLKVTAGNWNLQASLFGYDTVNSPITTNPGEITVHDISLSRLPTTPLTGHVLDEAGDPVPRATVEIVATPLPPSTSDYIGRFVIEGVPVGYEGIVNAFAAGMTPDARIFVAGGRQSSVDLRLADPFDFESDDGDFNVTSGEWEWGQPTLPDGPSAHSGTNCWGTDLDGGYNALQHHVLLTTPFNLQGMVDPRLTFWQWWALWGPYDGANVSISTDDGVSWEVISPIGGYDDSCIPAFPGAGCFPGYTSLSRGWVPGVFELSDHTDQTVRFRFMVSAYGINTDLPGWYIDDLRVHGMESASVPEAFATRFLFHRPAHNPMQTHTTLRFELTQSARVSLRLFGPSGRLIHVLRDQVTDAGRHELHWNGTTSNGRRVHPGVYFLRWDVTGLDGRNLASQSSKLVIVR